MAKEFFDFLNNLDEEEDVTSIDSPLIVQDQTVNDALQTQPLGSKQPSLNANLDTASSFGQFLGGIDEQDTALNQYKSNLANAMKVDADQYARSVKAGEAFDLPPNVAATALEQLERLRNLNDVDVNNLREQYPKLFEMMSTDDNFSSAAYDDLDVLGKIEHNLNILGNAGKAVIDDITTFPEGRQSGLAVADLGIIGTLIRDSQNGIVTEEQKLKIEELNQFLANNLSDAWFFSAGQIEGTMEPMLIKSATYGTTAAITTFGALELTTGPLIFTPDPTDIGAAATGLKVGGATFTSTMVNEMYKLEGGLAYLDMIEEGIEHDIAAPVSRIVGGINAGLELAGYRLISAPYRKVFNVMLSKQIIKSLTKKGALKSATGTYLKTWTGEVTTEVLQEIVQIGGSEIAKLFSSNEELESLMATEEGRAEVTRRLEEIFVTTAKGMSIIALPGGVTNYVSKAGKAKDAQTNQQVMQAISEGVTDSKLVDRLPAQAQAFVKKVLEGGDVENVYIESEKFTKYFQEAGLDFNSKEGKEFFQSIKVFDQLAEAEATGGDLVIPIDLYTTIVAPTEHHAGLSPDIRLRVEDWSAREADLWNKNNPNFMEDVQVEADRIIKEASKQEGGDQIFDQMVDQLIQTGVAREEANKDAALYRAFFTVMSDRAGMSEMDLFERYGLNVKRVMPEGLQEATQTAGLDMSLSAQAGELAKVILNPDLLQDQSVEGKETQTSKSDTSNETITAFHGSGKVPIFANFKFIEAEEIEGNFFGRKNTGGVGLANHGKGVYLTLDESKAQYYQERAAENKGEGHVYKTEVNATESQLIQKGLKLKDHTGVAHEAINTIMKSLASIEHESGVSLLAFIDSNAELDTAGRISPERKGYTFEDLTGAELVNILHGRISIRNINTESIINGKSVEDYLSSLGVRGYKVNAKNWLVIFDPENVKITDISNSENVQEFLTTGTGVEGIDTLDLDITREQVDQLRSFLETEMGFDLTQVSQEEVIQAIRDSFYDPQGNVLNQSKQSANAEDRLWRNWQPDSTKAGKLLGTPEWVKTDKDLAQLRRDLRSRLKEGLVGRYWYENSAQGVMGAVKGDVVEAEKFIQLLAIYSPNTEVFVNTMEAVRAYTMWKNGEPEEDFHIATGTQDKKAIDLLYHNKDWIGRKTDSFYKNLMHDIIEQNPEALEKLRLDDDLIESLSKPVTIDIWMFRAFGYVNEQAGDDKGKGKYSFAENEIRRLTARLNSNLEPGEQRWTPHQVQAAVWTSMKTRYELPEVKARTIKKSVNAGLTTIDENGKRILPTTKQKKSKHLAIWRVEAMKPQSKEVVKQSQKVSASFGDHLYRMTQIVTWEAKPSEALDYDIFNASPEAIRQFTAQARQLMVDEQGNDLLAVKLGVVLNWDSLSQGAYASSVAENILTHLLPNKMAGDFAKEEARIYAQAVQYIFKQDAVPWFRPDPMSLNSKVAQDKQLFRVINTNNGRTVSKSKVKTLKEAKKIAKDKGEGFEVRGGKFSKGVSLRFDKDQTLQDLESLLESLQKYLGKDAGYTRTASDEVVIINFRDDETGIPFVDDEVFVNNIKKAEDALHDVGVVDIVKFWSEGEYGNEHNWKIDTEGQSILDTGSLSGRSDLHPWIQDRRSAFDNLLEEYSGESLKLREEEADLGRVFFQEKLETLNQDKRGSIQFRSSETVISLFEKADRSTFLHESGHFFLQVMQDLGEDVNAPENIKKDWQTILKFLEVESGDQIGTEQHEKWAQAFEKYLFEGKSPSTELQDPFRRFKAWLTSVYKQLQNLGVEIDDDIRGIFDRMLATEQQIQEAERISNYMPAFESAEQAGMTETEWKNYQDTANRASREAEDDLDHKKLTELERERKRWWIEEREKVSAEVEREINQMPIYQVIHFLQTGEALDGELIPGIGPMKLDRKALLDDFGKILGQLPRAKQGVHVKEGGVHHDKVARLFDFDSGAQMIEEMIKAKKRKDLIDETTTERMMQTFGDMMSDTKKLQEEALKSAHMSDQRGRFFSIELKALSKRANVPDTPANAAREAAKDIIGRKKVSQIHVGKLRAAELRASKAAEKAIGNEDWNEAVKQKRNQLLNHYLYREAEKAQAKVDMILRHLNKFQRPGVRKNLARDYLDQIDTILEKFDLKKSVTLKSIQRRKSFTAWVKEQEANGSQVIISSEMEKILEAASKVHYKDLSFEQFLDMDDLVKNIEHLARFKQSLIEGQQRREFREVVGELVGTAQQEHDLKDEAPSFRDQRLEKMYDVTAMYLAEHEKIEFLMRFLDGEKDNGTWWRHIFKPIADAEDAEMIMQENFSTRLNEIFESRYTIKDRKSWGKIVATFKTGFTKRHILSIALNWGNLENRAAVLEGLSNQFGVTRDNVEQLLDEHMSQKDWEMVQDILNMVNDLWPQIASMQRELTGVTPAKVVAEPIKTKYGTFAGGYYPLKYDPKFSHRQEQRSEKESTQDLLETNWLRPATKKGHTIERVGSGGQMVRLDLGVLSEHMTNVIHDLTHRLAVIQIDRLTQHEKVREVIEQAAGKQVYRQIRPWLQGVANDRVPLTSNLEKGLAWGRHGASIVAMGFKMTTALVQPLGFTQSVVLLGEKWAWRGLTGFYKNPIQNREAILKKSVFMRHRMQTLDRDVRDSLNRVSGEESRLKSMHSKYFMFIGWMDMTVSLPTWQGGYEKSISQGMSEEDAIAHGDSMVRQSQAGGGVKDLASIQRGHEFKKMFTMFYSYFSALWNMQKRTLRMRKEGRISNFEAFRHFIWLVALPAVLSEMLLGREPDDDDDDESLTEWVLETTFTYPLYSIVGIRDVVNKIENPYFTMSTPVLDVFDEMIDALSRTDSIWTDEEFTKADYKKFIVGTSYLLQMPGRQAANMYEHLHEVMEGEDFSLWDFLVKNKRK